MFTKGGIKARYEYYRVWTRLLRHRRTRCKNYGHFDFGIDLKTYIKLITSGNVIDAELSSDGVKVPLTNLVKCLVRHLVEPFLEGRGTKIITFDSYSLTSISYSSNGLYMRNI